MQLSNWTMATKAGAGQCIQLEFGSGGVARCKRQDARMRFLPQPQPHPLPFPYSLLLRFLRLPPQFPPFIISGFIQEGNGDWWVGRRPSGGSLAGQLLSLLPLFFFPFFFSAFQLCDFVALPNTCMLMQQPSLSQHSGTRKAVTRTKHMI